jgi:hypothetical protein
LGIAGGADPATVRAVSDSLDWRLETNEERWMHGARLRWARFEPLTDDWDHEHCALCWAEFDVDGESALREGYLFRQAPLPAVLASEEERTTVVERGRIVRAPSDDSWICPTCFADFEQHFGWVGERD